MIFGRNHQKPRQVARHSFDPAPAVQEGAKAAEEVRSDRPLQSRSDCRSARTWPLGCSRENCFVLDRRSRSDAFAPHTELTSPVSMSPLHRARCPKIKAERASTRHSQEGYIVPESVRMHGLVDASALSRDAAGVPDDLVIDRVIGRVPPPTRKQPLPRFAT